MLHRLRAALRNLFGKRRVDQDLDEELASYEAHLADEHAAGGLDPDSSRRAARLQLEGRDHVKEAVRDVRAGAFIELLVRDVRYAFRTLARSPGFTAFTLLTFAVSLGGLAVMGSMVNSLLLKPLPYADSDRLVAVLETDDDDLTGGNSVAAPNFLDWREQNRVFSAMALYAYSSSNLTEGAEPEVVGSLRVTGGVFELLGVRPMLGRGLLPADDASGAHVVVLSHGLWQRRFGGDSAVVGKTIRINGVATEVIGVMPQSFAFPSRSEQLWTPVAFGPVDQRRQAHLFLSIARLKDGVSVAEARTEMRTVGFALAKAYPATNQNETVNVFPLSELWIEDTRGQLGILLAAVTLVLLIASANIASLLVARNGARRREIAARMALGGSRGRILTQLVTESVVLSLAGAGIGLLLAGTLSRILVNFFSRTVQSVPFREVSPGLDPIVALAALLVALLAGIGAGVVPALTALPSEPAEVLREGEGRTATARHTHRIKSVLVAAEVALALVVVVGAGLLITSLGRLARVEPGFDPKGVRLLELTLPQADQHGPAERLTLCEDLTREIAAVPGVRSVSAMSHVPLDGSGAGWTFGVEGESDPGPDKRPSGDYGVICPGYFGTMGIPLLSGRDFTPEDRAASARVMIVNQALAKKYFGGADPVGRRIKLDGVNSERPWTTIIGLTGDVRNRRLADDVEPFLYAPYAQAAWPTMAVTVKADPGLPLEPIRRAIRRVAPADPIGWSGTMERMVERSLGHVRFPMLLFSGFAAMALGLAALGCFGVASQSVVQRRRELGIRLALGARKSQMYRMVVGQAMRPVAFGLVLGTAAAIGFARVLRALLYGIAPGDPVTLLLGGLVLAGVAVLASLWPARRAAQVDPAQVLRDA